MGNHFTSYTPEAMRNLAGELRTELHRRTDFVRGIREQVPLMLTKFRDEHHNMAAVLRQRLAEQERQRLQQAEKDADARREFVSRLKSEVNQKCREMAAELRAASDAWNSRETRRAESFTKSYQQPIGWPVAEDKSETESDSSSKAKGKKSKTRKSRD